MEGSELGRGDKRNRKSIGLDLAPAPRKQPNGRKRRTAEQRDKSVQGLKVRCRQMGRESTSAAIREARAPWWGCSAGRVIADSTMGNQERSELWDAICTMRKRVTVNDVAIGLPRRHPAAMRLLAPVDEMSADAQSPTVDLRTDEQKAKEAESKLMEMEGWLGYTDKAAASEAKRVVIDDMNCIDPEGLLSALRCVSDGLKGKELRYRGRG